MTAELTQKQVLETAALLRELCERAESLDSAESDIRSLLEGLIEALEVRNEKALLYNLGVDQWKMQASSLSDSVASPSWKDSLDSLAVPEVDPEWKIPGPEFDTFSDLIDPEKVTLQVTEPAA